MQVEVEQEQDGRWIAEIASIPGAMAYGATKPEAVLKANALAQNETQWRKTFAASRRKLVPLARVRGIRTDRDVFKQVS